MTKAFPGGLTASSAHPAGKSLARGCAGDSWQTQDSVMASAECGKPWESQFLCVVHFILLCSICLVILDKSSGKDFLFIFCILKNGFLDTCGSKF